MYRQAISDLLDVYETRGRVQVGQAKRHRMLVVHGMSAYVVAQVRAALALLDAGHGFAAQVNARVAYEHALSLQWLHQTDDGLEKFVKKSHRSAQTLLRGAAEAGLDVPTDLAEELAGAGQEAVDPDLRTFENLCRRFDRSGWLYVVYRQLSARVHPSNATTASYLDRRTEPPGLLREADLNDDRPLLWTLAFATALAVGAHEDLVRGKPNKAKVRDIATSVGLLALLDPS